MGIYAGELTIILLWRSSTRGAVSSSIRQNKPAQIQSVAAIHIELDGPNPSEAIPARAGPAKPPASSPTPMMKPSAVATWVGGIVSDGTVAMNNEKLPTARWPTPMNKTIKGNGPSNITVVTGAITPTKPDKMRIGRRPNRSDSDGTMIEDATVAIPVAATATLITLGDRPRTCTR